MSWLLKHFISPLFPSNVYQMIFVSIQLCLSANRHSHRGSVMARVNLGQKIGTVVGG